MKRLLLSMLVMLSALPAGCGAEPGPIGPPEELPYAVAKSGSSGSGSSGSGSGFISAPTTNRQVKPEDVFTRLWGNGTAAQGNVNLKYLAFSVEASQTAQGIQGSFFVANSVVGLSFWGAITGGRMTYSANGTREAVLTGVLTNLTPFTLRVTDTNSDNDGDTFALTAPGAPQAELLLPFSGQVFQGDARIVRALDPEFGLQQPMGFRFDPEIGLFVSNADRIPEILSLFEPVPDNVIQVIPPDPVMDFQRNRPGGLLTTPGTQINVPGLFGVEPYVKPIFDQDFFPNNNDLKGFGGNSNSGQRLKL
jgi:hypothetical protein